MARYALIEGDVVVNVIEWDGAADYAPPDGATLVPLSVLPYGVDVGWRQDAVGAWSPPAAPAQAVGPTPLAFLQFMALFTPAEQAAIFTARRADVQTDIFITMAAGAGGLALDDPHVVAGVNYLATPPTAIPPGPGAIAPARVAEILAGQPAG